MKAARGEALELGWYLQVEALVNVPPERACVATAVAVAGGPGRFLAFGRDGAEAAEHGTDVLRGIVERGERWPEQDPD